MVDSVLCVYLALNGWQKQERAFRDSYEAHPGDVEHVLSVVRRAPGEPGYDMGVMLSEAKDAAEEGFSTMVFLGSHSRILADNWLSQLAQGAKFGAASATGSYEQGISSHFPNHHLRTNALAIDPRLLVGICREPIITKHDCHELEHGDVSLSRRVKATGRKIVVAGQSSIYHERSWWCSGTFRSDEQIDLLVADNRTDAYMAADQDTRRQLEQLAWGRAL